MPQAGRTEAEAFEHLGERAYTGPLFPEPEGVRGDSEARDEAGQGAAGALGAGSKRSGGRIGRREAAAGQLVAHSLSARGRAAHREDSDTYVAHALRGDGHDASDDGSRRTLIVATAEGGRSVNLTRSNIGKQIHNQSPLLVFGTTQITSAENRCKPEPGDPCHQIASGAHPPAIAFSCKDHGADAAEELAPTLRSMAERDAAANGGGQVAYALRADASRDGEAKTPSADAEGNVRLRDPGFNVYKESAPTLDAGQPHTVAFHLTQDPISGDIAPAMGQGSSQGHATVGVAHGGTQIRRLTPMECERLMGMRDGYTLIVYRGKFAKDGPRYKALGNSMVRDVMLWIGRRIELRFAA